MRRVALPPPLEWPNFAVFLQETTARYSNRVALRYRGRGEQNFEEWTYGRLATEASALARLLRDRGLGQGDRVALWSENRLEWAAAYLGVVAAGMVIVPIDALADEDEAAAILSTAEVSALVLSAKFTDSLGRLLRSARSVSTTVLLGAQHSQAGALTWEEVLARGGVSGVGASGAAAFAYSSSLASDAPASIIFTSGTTGKPKGVVLSHGGIIANIDAARQALPIDAEDVFMCVLPLHHTYPTTCSLLAPLSIGASATLCEKVVGKVIVDDVRDSRGSVMIAVPLLYDKLAQALLQGVAARPLPVRALVRILFGISRLGLALSRPGVGVVLLAFLRAKTGLGSLRLLVAGGGPLSASTAAVFDRFGFSIVQGYGMSENGPLISTNSPEHRDHRSAGTPVLRTELRIADPGPDGIGEIQVRSPSLMLGYWRDAETSAAIFTADRWLRTGDLGTVDHRGFVFITGRIKSIIVTAGGKNIYPEEIEAKFEGSRVVKEILVLGKPPEERGAELAEEVGAVAVPDLEAIAAEQGEQCARDRELVRTLVKAEIERVNRSLPPFKKISDFALRDEEFEKTSSKKIKRYLYRGWKEATGLR